jgi:urease accessory protein
MPRALRPFALTVGTAAPAASAHSGHAESFASAFAHPFGGLDHLLAMVLVGLWAGRAAAAQGAARALALPLAFTAAAGIGLWTGMLGASLAFTEHAIVTSVVVLGLALAAAAPATPVAAVPLCAAFGFFHGLAHGAELHGAAASTAAGLVVATALLHAAGFAVVRAAGRRGPLLARLAGAGAGVAGLALAGPRVFV